jgi:hypothetical protein
MTHEECIFGTKFSRYKLAYQNYVTGKWKNSTKLQHLMEKHNHCTMNFQLQFVTHCPSMRFKECLVANFSQ